MSNVSIGRSNRLGQNQVQDALPAWWSCTPPRVVGASTAATVTKLSKRHGISPLDRGSSPPSRTHLTRRHATCSTPCERLAMWTPLLRRNHARFWQSCLSLLIAYVFPDRDEQHQHKALISHFHFHHWRPFPASWTRLTFLPAWISLTFLLDVLPRARRPTSSIP